MTAVTVACFFLNLNQPSEEIKSKNPSQPYIKHVHDLIPPAKIPSP
jgi:hypothetical protein